MLWQLILNNLLLQEDQWKDQIYLLAQDLTISSKCYSSCTMECIGKINRLVPLMSSLRKCTFGISAKFHRNKQVNPFQVEVTTSWIFTQTWMCCVLTVLFSVHKSFRNECYSAVSICSWSAARKSCVKIYPKCEMGVQPRYCPRLRNGIDLRLIYFCQVPFSTSSGNKSWYVFRLVWHVIILLTT